MFADEKGEYFRETLKGGRHGLGKNTAFNGDIYKGDYEENKMKGKGKLAYKNGNVYE